MPKQEVRRTNKTKLFHRPSILILFFALLSHAGPSKQTQPPQQPRTNASETITPFTFNTPSPDDVVLSAQQQQRRPGGAGAAAGGAPNSVTSAVSNLTINGPPPPPLSTPQQQQPPPLVVSDYVLEADLQAACDAVTKAETTTGAKPHLHLVVLGHVDAGKSTLMGRMLYELGHIDEKTVHKAKRESAAAGKASFAWAWMLDERPEERARGVTVDVAVNRFETVHRSVTLLDAPGHKDFIPNMIAGAAQADAALLVVDGSPGGFESGFAAAAVGSIEGGGQTREHAQLARSLGVEQAAVVVTKLDTCGYSQSRFEEIKAQLEPFLKQCGFKTDTAVQWVPAVGPSGENLVATPQDERLAAWYSGPCLSSVIDCFTPSHRLLDRPLRVPVAEVTSRGAKGTTVGGKIESGAVRCGTKVLITPSREVATVKSIMVDGKSAVVGRAGDNCDLLLTGIDSSAVHAGDVLSHPDFPVPLAVSFEVEVVVLDVVIPVLQGQQVTVHAHAARDSGYISKLVALLDGKTGKVTKVRPRCLLKGQTARIEVVPSRPLPLELYSTYKALGRVALRDGGKTVCVGIVTAVSGSTG